MLIERLEPPVPWLDALDKVLAAGTGAALVEVVDGPPGQLGAKVVVGEDGAVIFPALAGASSAARRPGSLRPPSPLAPSTTPWPIWLRGAVPPTVMRRGAGRTKLR